MLQLKARIKISGTTETATIGAVSNLKGNNVSGTVNDVVDKVSVPLGNPFVLGKSVLGSRKFYNNHLDYYMGAQLSDASGFFAEKYIITIQGKTKSNYIIVFDKENKQYPNNIIVDGKTIFLESPQAELEFDKEKDVHTIEIDNWNTEDCPMIITGLYAVTDIEITQWNLENFRSSIMDRQSENYPNYGLISNGANLSFYDFNEKALDLIITKALHSGAQVSVWLGDNEVGTYEQICEMEIRELSYDNNNKKVDITLKDNLEDMQNINVAQIDYDPINPVSVTAYYFYQYLRDIAVGTGKFLFEDVDTQTLSVLNATTIEYPILESGNLWDCWEKLCELCLLHMYINNNNKIVIKYGV